uniref:Amine oxidase n=1 Tax=Aegilops tauschii subsp. strangulata TaxID=200361 RepID=A0A453IV48_AEGTS
MLPLLLAAVSILTAAAASAHHPHPLDPLSPAELTAVRAAVLASPLVPARPLTFHYVGLDEPDKADVLSYAYGNSTSSSRSALPRRAFVVARAGGQSHELRVDVTDAAAPSVLAHAVHRGAGFPTLTLDEQFAAVALPPAHPPFVESVRRRGVDMADVLCAVFPVGWFGGDLPGEERRVVKLLCFVAGATANFYARPLEGVTLVVDLDRMAIVGYRDRVLLPVPKAEGTDYRAGKAGPPYAGRAPAPGTVVQPEGRGFDIDGHFVRWANWEFHVGFDVRAGTVISLASIHDADAGARRRVLYRGFVSEVFVPYMDPVEEWYYRTFLDAGEYGLGLWAFPLQPGADCPANAAYLDGYYAGQDGKPVENKNMICVFERYAGDVAWRHTEAGITEVRPDVSLVVRMVVSCGNYDYTGLGVQDQRLHQIHGVSDRPPGGEGDGLHARGPDHGGRARHAGGGEHPRRLPRPLRHVPPGPRRRRHQQLLRQEHHRHQAQRGRHAEEELLDGAPGGGRDRGGRAGGRERRAGRPAGRQPQQADPDGQRGRVPGRPGRRDGGVGAGRRRLPAEARQLLQEAGAGDAVQQGGEVGARAVRRPEHRRRRPGRLEREGQGDTERGHRAVVHGGHPPHPVPG